MKSVHYLLLVISLLVTQISLAQKSAPVAGDAAALVDLLKKDYNSIDHSTRDEELVKDRAFAISTLKSYLTETQKTVLTQEVQAATPKKTYNTELTNYRNAQQLFSSYSSAVAGSPKSITEAQITASLDKFSKASETAKKAYYAARYQADNQELGFLKTAYDGTNEYVEYIVYQFINKYTAIEGNFADALAKSNPNASLQKSIPFLGGDMGFEVVIEGLSKFLAKRIKQELTTQVITKIQEWLKNPNEDDPLAELKVLLPRTNAYLLDFKASQVTSFPNEIKQYIEDDFNHLIDNLKGLRNTPRIKRLIASHPDVEFAMEALSMIPDLAKIKNPIDYFETIENNRNLNRWRESSDPVKFNIANALRLSSLLAHSLTIIDNGQPRFVGGDFFNSYATDINFYVLYLGFLHQQNLKYHDIQFYFKTSGKISIEAAELSELVIYGRIFKAKVIKTTSEDLIKFPLSVGLYKLVGVDLITASSTIETLKRDREFFERIFFQIGEHAEKVYTAALEIKKANKVGERIGPDSVYTFVKSVIDLAEEVTSAGDTLTHYLMKKTEILDRNIEELKIDYTKGEVPGYTLTGTNGTSRAQPVRLKEKAEPYFAVANKANEIALDLQTKKYTTAIIKALEVSTVVLPDRFRQSVDLLSKAVVLLPEIKGDKNPAIKNWSSEDWNVVLPIIKDGVRKEIDKNIAKSSTRIYDELNKIRIYYHLHYVVEDEILNGLIMLMDRVNKMKAIETMAAIPGEELAVLQPLLKNKKFGYVVVSYYSQVRIDELADEMEEEMKQLTVDIKGIPTSVFTPEEALKSKTLFLKYVDAVFTFSIDGDKSKVDAANGEFKEFASDCLLRAPKKFNLHISENVLKLIHFVNDMAVSQNSDDIAKAIEAFALPAGSYSIKRDALFNISMNSFPGILPALELTWKNKTCYTGFSPSFTAPVGFSFTGSKKGASHGVFVPIIDIGAVTRMYLGEDVGDASTSTLPEFSFLSVFSPGLYYHWGFPKTPLSLNIGAQYGPGLKEVTSTGETKIYESVRIGAGLVLDIPLLNLHTKARFKK